MPSIAATVAAMEKEDPDLFEQLEKTAQKVAGHPAAKDETEVEGKVNGVAADGDAVKVNGAGQSEVKDEVNDAAVVQSPAEDPAAAAAEGGRRRTKRKHHKKGKSSKKGGKKHRKSSGKKSRRSSSKKSRRHGRK